MATLYSFENGILIPYTLSNQQQLLSSMRGSALPSAAQFGVELNQTEQTSTDSDKTAQQATTTPVSSAVEQIQQQTVPPAATQLDPMKLLAQQQQATTVQPSNEAEAWKQLYMQSMAELEKQRQANATMQVEIARQAIIGQKNSNAEDDLTSSLNAFFGYTE